jgi:hypothetical protein
VEPWFPVTDTQGFNGASPEERKFQIVPVVLNFTQNGYILADLFYEWGKSWERVVIEISETGLGSGMQAYALVTASTGSFLCFFLKTC